MSGRKAKNKGVPPPRDILRGMMADDMLAAAGRVMPEAMAVIFHGYGEAFERVRAAMPASVTQSEAEAVAAEILKCFGVTIRLLWGIAGGEAIAADQTDAGKLMRFTLARSLLKASGFKADNVKEEIDFLCQNQPPLN